jgi:hypothetical protein
MSKFINTNDGDIKELKKEIHELKEEIKQLRTELKADIVMVKNMCVCGKNRNQESLSINPFGGLRKDIEFSQPILTKDLSFNRINRNMKNPFTVSGSMNLSIT